ncbi:alpha/beta fold hydrolase [Georgenia deserti]|uniref:Alpha/beta fold hydrolase n=1 Tax=Georgenia deserti TaxID=2093781 RepID=A0ABW4L5X8_9MICO
MAEAQLNRTRLAYDVVGDGPTIVFVAGLGMDRTTWRRQVDFFRITHRVVTFDVRGAGGSGPLHARSGVLATQAADLKALLEHLGIARAVLCGVSFGGILAQEFAIRYPDRIAGLVLCDTFCDMKLASRLSRTALVLAAQLAVPMLLVPSLSLPAVRRMYARWPHARNTIVKGYRNMRRVETVRMRLAINRVQNHARLQEVACPVLGLVGDESPQLVELMHRVVDSLGTAELRVLKNSFDPSNLTQPDTFNSAVHDFLIDVGWIAQTPGLRGHATGPRTTPGRMDST